jgi:hypothetical protein
VLFVFASRVFAPAPGSAVRNGIANLRITVFVSRVFAPAPGSAVRERVANLRISTPFAKPRGRATRVSRTCASPRLRQSLAALDFGYGLNEKAPGSAVRNGIANLRITVFVSRVFAPAPGSAVRKYIANLRVPTPFAEPQGRATQSVGRYCAAPRLRQSLAALGSGYGLNER